MDQGESSYAVNPIVKDLLEAGGRVIQIEGYMGPSNRDCIQFFQDLSLSRYLEIPKKDIVRVVNLPDHPDGLCKVFIRSSAELRYISVTSFKADDVLLAAAAVQTDADTDSIARVSPPDNCAGRCEMSYRACISRHGGDFWCAVAYGGCILACTFFPGTITTGGIASE